MNARRLLIVTVILGGICIALTSRSTLTPQRGSNNVFYGGAVNDFMAQEVGIGDFNGDDVDDIVTTFMWDNPTCGGYILAKHPPTSTICSTFGWTRFLAEKDGDTLSVCKYQTTGPYAGDNAEHWSYWACLGWDSIPGSSAACDTCYTAEFHAEDQGAAFIFYGGDWSGKDHDIDLSSGGADVVILGRVPGGRIYNGIATGDMDGDGKSEVVLGAPDAGDAGEVYVIHGSNAWPDTINLANPTDFSTWVDCYIIGRDEGDKFGLGVAAGDLNDDGNAEIMVAAPRAASLAGEVFVFYPDGGLPDTVNLATTGDQGIADYAQVIHGAAAGDSMGVTTIPEVHPAHHGRAPHNGNYEPTAISVGDWDGDDTNDLAVGAGNAGTRAGAAYVIFGGTKLAPGNPIFLANSPGTSTSNCDIKIVGATGMAAGAGLAFVDADGGDGKDDLLVGAPRTSSGGKSERGKVFAIFGDSRGNLTSVGSRTRDLTNSGHTDVAILGESASDQLGGHFSGATRSSTHPLDLDDDGKNDLGIAGKSEMTVIFGRTQASWPSSIDLGTAISTDPDMRIIGMQPQQYASSTTIRLADLDGDDFADLVFGGYDSPGYSPADPTGDSGVQHGGQMWVTKGNATWKSGAVSSNTTWAGNVFVDGDVVVTGSHTLTIAAGTDVWMWPTDVQKNGLGVDTIRVELRIESGSLVVNGTEDRPVRFLAWDPSNPETDSNTKWFGIWIDDGCTGTIDHAIIRNAYRGIQTRSPLTVTNSTIEDCVYVGVTVAGDSTNADSLYIADTTIRRIPGSGGTGGIGINVLGKKAVADISNCTIRDCSIGVAVYSKGKVWGYMDVSHTSSQAVQVSSRGWAQLSGSYASDGTGLKLTDGGYVKGTAVTLFKGGDFGVNIEKDGANLPSAYFDRCLIDSSGVGAQVSDTPDVEFDHCDVNYNEDDGIYCLSDADVIIDACYVQHNGDTGIRCDDSGPEITRNDVQYNGGGITCQNFAHPLVRANKIWNNTSGIAFVDDATADLTACGGYCPPCDDGNSFKLDMLPVS